MKTWITQTAAGVLAVAAISLTACKKDEVQATLTPTNSLTLTSSATNVVLTQANASAKAATFTFTPSRLPGQTLTSLTTPLPRTRCK
jgi:hypothetical protein